MVFVFDHPQLNSLRSEADAMIGEGKKLCYAKLIWRYADFLWFIHRSWWKHPKDHHWRWDSASPWSIFLHFEGQNQSQIPLALPWLWFQIASMLQIFHNSQLFHKYSQVTYMFLGFWTPPKVSLRRRQTMLFSATFADDATWPFLEALRHLIIVLALTLIDWLIVAEYYLVLLIFQNMSCMSQSRNDTECPRLLTFEWGQWLGHVDKLELQSAWEDCCVEISNYRRITDI